LRPLIDHQVGYSRSAPHSFKKYNKNNQLLGVLVGAQELNISGLRKIDHAWSFSNPKAVEQFREINGLAAYHNKLIRKPG